MHTAADLVLGSRGRREGQQGGLLCPPKHRCWPDRAAAASKLEAVPEILGGDAWGLAEERQGEVGRRRGGMVELRGRAGRRNGALLPPAPDLDPAGAGGAAEAGGEGEGEGRWRQRARELGERGRRRGGEMEREVVGEESEGE
ncbi:hypothetical protein GQ55_5G405200 [Panicum hallii var. hallii]|uniref:DUF834 domain-containing protein n=1 Tax=Panicum hallii var. hallii TaxID=1504633 RepID=A0A2T7DNJ9_9POAL|nr:hypothetical protein GQ55_5G405200 [Panicum hallii var. hallii]